MEANKINQSKEIAKTILNQIKGLSPYALMSWGSQKYTLVENGLKFQINTPKISKGWIEIILDISQDLYKINTYNNRKRLLESKEGVFFDELVYHIDLMVENPEYISQIRR